MESTATREHAVEQAPVRPARATANVCITYCRPVSNSQRAVHKSEVGEGSVLDAAKAVTRIPARTRR